MRNARVQHELRLCLELSQRADGKPPDVYLGRRRPCRVSSDQRSFVIRFWPAFVIDACHGAMPLAATTPQGGGFGAAPWRSAAVSYDHIPSRPIDDPGD